MNKEGILIVVSGFSGAGKGTIMKALLERYDNYALSISATTRNPRPLLLFVTPPRAEELRKRLEGRGTETQEVIDGRMKRAIEEAEYMDQYDYLVVNDELDVCVEEMHHLIQGEHERCFRNQTFIEHMKRELKGE